MFRSKLLALIVVGLSLYWSDSIWAQPVLTTINTTYGARYTVQLDESVENTVYATVNFNTIDLLINGQFYQFKQVDHNVVKFFNVLTILDGEKDCHIELNGGNYPTMKLAVNCNGGDDWVSNNTSMQSYLYGDAGNDFLRGGFSEDSIYGSSGKDILEGRSGDDNIFGGVGNDDLDGGSGNDYMHGEQGFDLVMGGAGNDFVSGNRYKGVGFQGASRPDGDVDLLSGGSGADYFPYAYYWRQSSGGFYIKRYHEKDLITDFNNEEDTKRDFYYPK